MESKTIANAIVFTALVAAATMVFSVYLPATRGYFNVGEIMVYTAALLMGPYVGAFAGGVGSMISDLLLGYAQFAPGTLAIKGAEGFIVGYLGHKSLSLTRGRWRALAVALGAGIALIVWLVPGSVLAGEAEASLGLPQTGTYISNLYIPGTLWIGLALIAFVLIVLTGFSVEPKVGWLVLSVLVGGTIMVTGYFLYEIPLVGLSAALFEVPLNIGQVTVGLLGGVPLARTVAGLLRESKLKQQAKAK